MKRVLVGFCTLSLGGCASVFGGISQEIEITTTPPGAVMVGPSRHDLTIVCTKAACQPSTASCSPRGSDLSAA